MENQTTPVPVPDLENDDVFIGRRGAAVDFFDDYPQELEKYAKSKGMFTRKDIDAMESLKGSDYNEAPAGFREITKEEFGLGFFHYILKPECSKQIHRDANGVQMKAILSIRLWEVEYTGWEGMGYAISYEYDKKKMHYFKFGEEERWKKNENAFAAQFAGDNS